MTPHCWWFEQETRVRVRVAVAERGDTGLAQAKEQLFDVVITDLKMPGLSGLELVEQLHAAKPKLPILLMTAFGTTETAIEATKLGAYDYLLKPFDMAELLDLVAKAVASNRLMSEPVEMGQSRSNQSAIVGHSRAMQSVYKEIDAWPPRRHRARSRRNRHRQGTGRPRHLPAQRRAAAVHRRQLRAIPSRSWSANCSGTSAALHRAHARRVAASSKPMMAPSSMKSAT